jgi:hypothetical protein
MTGDYQPLLRPCPFPGGVSNVDMNGNNALYIKAIQVFISTFETLPGILYYLHDFFSEK